jgi:hypothetical protein
MATKRKDFTQIALDVVKRATGGEVAAPAPKKPAASPPGTADKKKPAEAGKKG